MLVHTEYNISYEKLFVVFILYGNIIDLCCKFSEEGIVLVKVDFRSTAETAIVMDVENLL